MASGEKHKIKRKVYVPSRYMQAAEKISIQNSKSREKSTFLKVNRDNLELTSSYDSASHSKNSLFPEAYEMTSTPAFRGECPYPSFTPSVVTNLKKCQSVPNVKEAIGSLTSIHPKKFTFKKSMNDISTLKLFTQGPAVASSHKPVIKTKNIYKEKLAEDHIDLLYAQYLQAKFLEMESKNALKKRCSSALEKNYKLFCLLIVHLKELKKLLELVEMLSFYLKTLNHCKKQEEIFKPIFDVLEPLEKQYESIAEAVNKAKHKLHVKDIILPEPGSEGELIDLQESIHEILKNFFEKFRNVEKICMSAEILENYVNLEEQISDALKRGSELLSQAQDLAMTEASFKLGTESFHS